MAGLSVEWAALGYGTLGSVSNRVIPTAVDHSDQGGYSLGRQPKRWLQGRFGTNRGRKTGSALSQRTGCQEVERLRRRVDQSTPTQG